MVTIESVKIGDLFKLKENSSVVYVKGEYNRFAKKYTAHKWEDINHHIYKKKGTLVFVDFEF